MWSIIKERRSDSEKSIDKSNACLTNIDHNMLQLLLYLHPSSIRPYCLVCLTIAQEATEEERKNVQKNKLQNQLTEGHTARVLERKWEEMGWLPVSAHYRSTKEALDRVESRLAQDKEIPKDKKENYQRVVKEINYTMGKVGQRWPAEVDKLVDNLKAILTEFEAQLTSLAKGSSIFCGSSGSPKQLEGTFRRLAGYEHIFTVIRPFQDKQIRDDIIARYEEEQQTASRKTNKEPQQKEREKSKEKINEKTNQKQNEKTKDKSKDKGEKCLNCELMLAVSLCPNGFIAKKLLKKLPDTEWIAGILHEEGTIVDKDLDKAIQYYKAAYKKKNYQALYRLGSLNERGLYGKPFEYLKMWEQASNAGHLQALTDMGYLYENGLQDEDTDRVILQPNFEKAHSYYLKAAEHNFPRALNNLATFYFSNDKYRDEKKCLQFLELAAQAEYVKALHNLGLIYYEGKLVNQDENKARGLIRRAAEKGDIEGRIMHIQLTLSDPARCTADQLTELNRYCREIIAKDEENAEAHYFLGLMYEQGYGVPKQPKTAFLYYTIAASMQSQPAYMRLGDCHRNGFGTQQDAREAVRCYEQAVRTNKEALISLGEVYQKGGQDLSPNYQRAFELYYQACNFGLPQAYLHLGAMYKQGRHVKKNEAKAEQYFQKAQNMQRQSKKLNASSSDLIQSSYYRRR